MLLTIQANMQSVVLSCLTVHLLHQDEDINQGQEMDQSSLLLQTNPLTSGTTAITPLQQQVKIRVKRVRQISPILPAHRERNGAPAQQMSHYDASSLNGGSGGEERVRDSTCAHTQQTVVFVRMLFDAR